MLRFEAPLEREFRAHYAARNLPLARVSLLLVVLLMGVLAWLDWRTQPSEFSAYSIAVRLGFVAPFALIALPATYPGPLARFADRFIACALVALGLGTLIILWRAAEAQVPLEFAALGGVTVSVYLIFGLRLFPALVLTLPLVVAFILMGAFVVETSQSSFFYDVLALVLINLVAAFGCYRLEHSARTIFLEREIVNILAGSDALTGIPNRRLFNNHLQSVRRQAERESRGIALGLVDLDHFDAFRNRYGREASEVCLRRVAHAIMRCARRPLDFAARFSGEEFAVVLYDSQVSYVERLAGQIRDHVAMLDIAHDASPVSERVTVSIGMALSGATRPQSAQALLELADEALQEAKAEGGNRVVVKYRSAGSQARVFQGPWPSPKAE